MAEWPRVQMSLSAVLGETAARRHDGLALNFDGSWLTYGELEGRAGAVAALLQAANVGVGQRVAVGLGNSVELVATVLGVLKAGAVLVPLNPAYTADELLYVLGDAAVAAAFLGAEHRRSAEAAGHRNCLDAPLTGSTIGVSIATRPEDGALMIYTSGTTGRPKGAVLSNAALVSNLQTVASAWRWTPEDRLLLALPCFHLHGLGLGILTSLLVGSSIVLKRRFAVESTLDDLALAECTMFFGVPTMYNRLVSLPVEEFHNRDLHRMRLWVSGSAPLHAATYEAFEERSGFALMDRYGMTECGFALSTRYDEARRPGVVGRPLPGVEVRLVDSDAANVGELCDVADGVQGEILIRGPNLFSGYWHRPQETAQAMLQGYLRSGDLAVRESDGQFRIVGRSSVDIIKTRGFKVGALEIETVLQHHRAVQEVAVVGVPDSDQGERIVAAVTLQPGAFASEDELRDFARLTLAPHKVPQQIVFVAEIPRIGPGKFKKKELIRQLT